MVASSKITVGILNSRAKMAPCDRGHDMYWRNNLIKGSSFQMHNKHERKCLDLRKLSKGNTKEVNAILSECANKPDQQIDFIK